MSLVLNVEILGEFKKLTAATQGAQTDLQKMSKRADSVSKGIGKAFAAIGVGLSFKWIANELEEAAKAAIEDVKSQTLLANQLENTTGATEAQIKAVERNISALQLQTSITDDKLRPAMAQLTRATGSTSEATKLLTLATDISAQTGKDLTTVSLGLSKAYNGQFGALSKLGIPMTDSIQNAQLYSTEMKKLTKLQGDANYALETYGIKSKEYIGAQEKVVAQQGKVNDIARSGIDWQNQLGQAFEGAAVKAANTDPYQRMQVIFGELQETVGMALLPTLEKFATWVASPEGQEKLQKFIDLVTGLAGKFEVLAGWAIDNADAIIAWSGVIVGAGLAIKGLTTAMSLYNTASAFLAARNAAIAASQTAIGTSATTAAVGVNALNTSLTFLLRAFGTAALVLALGGDAPKGNGADQQRDNEGRIINTKRNSPLTVPQPNANDPFLSPTGGINFNRQSVSPSVTINVNNPNATASDIIKKLDDYYKATGTRLIQ